MKDEIDFLKMRIMTLERLVKCEDCLLLKQVEQMRVGNAMRGYQPPDFLFYHSFSFLLISVSFVHYLYLGCHFCDAYTYSMSLFFDVLSWGGLSSGSSSFFLTYFLFSSFNPSFRKITAFTGLLGNSSKASTTKENRRERGNFFSVDANTHQNVFETTPKPIQNNPPNIFKNCFSIETIYPGFTSALSLYG